ncbi:MAG TPA: hypothetical protein VHO06_17105 [Polyangia bacterium]|nr:hypothetical protein [Polyangia bacterium]
MTQAELIGIGGALGAGCRWAFGLLTLKALGPPLRDLSANVIGPTVVVIGVHAGLAPTMQSGGRLTVATGALGGYMVVATLGAAHRALGEGAERLPSIVEILAGALGCLVAGAISLGLTHAFS